MRILKIGRKNLGKIVEIAVRALKKGQVLICPTDTVYGILADASNKKAIERIFKIKKRTKEKPLPIFVKDLTMAKKLAEIDKEQEKILAKVWPGKVTVVLMRKKLQTRTFGSVRGRVFGIDEETIALRAPKYRFLDNLLKKVNKPLAQTSANLSGKPTSNKISQIISQFENQKHQPDLILDVGNLYSSNPSKVIDLTGKTPKVLRY